MSGSDVAIFVGLGVLSLASVGVCVWTWRLDPRTGEPRRIPFTNRGQLALSLLLIDLCLFFVAIQVEAVPDAFKTLTGRAIIPLVFLFFGTWRFGWPAFLIPPWARN